MKEAKMDVAALSISLSSMKAVSSVSTSIMKKTMDVVNENAQLMFQSMRQMELSVNPAVGSKFDMRI